MSITESRAPTGTRTVDERAPNPSALRELMPPEGLREYWYPLVEARRVPRWKAMEVRLLGTDLAVFRGKDGRVAALDTHCPHRGASLAHGSCHFRGTVSCPYHGWTFDETGECVAALGEGPRSRLPGMRSTRARVFPTQTLKGLVFVWMGEGEPAPIEEDVPEEFFEDQALVQYGRDVWPCNWRVAMENINDSHVFYVHRNSVQFRLLPANTLLSFAHMGPRRPRPHVVNDRALVYRNEEHPAAAQILGDRSKQQGDVADDALPAGEMAAGEVAEVRDDTTVVEDPNRYQSIYPGLGGARWPKNGLRYQWSRLVQAVLGAAHAVGLQRERRPRVRNEEWNGLHLPATFRVDYFTHVYTRFSIPIDEERTRIIYAHTTRPGSTAARVWDRVFFTVWQNWQMNRNFSGQDKRVVAHQSFSSREKLSATDVFPQAWRALVVEHARDVRRQRAAVARLADPTTASRRGDAADADEEA